MRFILLGALLMASFQTMGAASILAITVDGTAVDCLNNKPGPQKTLFVLHADRIGDISRPEPFIADLVKKGWMIVHVDLPGTGRDQREGEVNFGHMTAILSVWSKRMTASEDVIGNYTKKISAIVDRLVVDKLVNPRYLYIYGRSAGGFMALESSLADSRFQACLLSQPVTDLSNYANFHTNEISEELFRTLRPIYKFDLIRERSIRIWFGPEDYLNRTADALSIVSVARTGADVSMKVVPAKNAEEPDCAQDVLDYLLKRKVSR